MTTKVSANSLMIRCSIVLQLEVIVAYLVFIMREDMGYEWRQLRRVVKEPHLSSNSGGVWPENRGGIVSRIRSRTSHWISENEIQLKWAYFWAGISLRCSLKQFPETGKSSWE